MVMNDVYTDTQIRLILAGGGGRRYCGAQYSQRDEVLSWDFHTIHVLRAHRTAVQYSKIINITTIHWNVRNWFDLSKL